MRGADGPAREADKPLHVAGEGRSRKAAQGGRLDSKIPAEAIKPLTDVIELIEDDQQSKQMLRTIIDDELATIKWFRKKTLTLLSASPAA